MLKKSICALLLSVVAQTCLAMDATPPFNQQVTNPHPFKFNFLSQKYPHLMDQANGPFTQVPSEDYTAWLAENGGKDAVCTKYKIILAKPVLDRELMLMTCPPHFIDRALAARTQIVNEMQESLTNDGFFKIYLRRKMDPKFSLFEDITIAAETIYEHVKHSGPGLVLFAGRTPAPIHLAYQKVLELTKTENQPSVHFNISGHPDIDTCRPSQFYQENQDLVRCRNMVTEAKLKHFYAYLDSLKILEHKKIYLVDIIGAGGGIRATVEIIKDYFLSHNVQFPEIEFLRLSNLFDLNNNVASKTNTYALKKSGPARGEIRFFADLDKNIKPLSLKTRFIHIDEATQARILDDDVFQTFFNPGIEYPPQKWTPAYDAERSRGAPFAQDLMGYWDANFTAYIKFHIGLVEKVSAEQAILAQSKPTQSKQGKSKPGQPKPGKRK